MKMKRLIMWVLALAMCLGLVLPGYAEEGTESPKSTEGLSLQVTPATNWTYKRFSEKLINSVSVLDGGTNVTAEFTISYSVDGGAPAASAWGEDAGTYSVVVTATPKEGGAYTGAALVSEEYSVTIAPLDISTKSIRVDYLEALDGLKCDGEEHALLISTIPDNMGPRQLFVVMQSDHQLSHNDYNDKDIFVWFEMDGQRYDWNDFPKAKDENVYVIDMYAQAANPNFTGTTLVKSFTAVLGRKPADMLTVNASGQSCTYDGQTHALLTGAAAIVDGETDVSEFFDISYTLKLGGTTVVSATGDYSKMAAANAGDYIVEITYTAKADTDYRGSITKTVPVSIAKLGLRLVPGYGQAKTYGQTAEDVEAAIADNYSIAVTTGGAKMTAAQAKAELEAVGAVLVRAEGEDVGEYAITLSPAAAALTNFDIQVDKVNFVINPVKVHLRAKSGLSKTYGQTAPKN